MLPYDASGVLSRVVKSETRVMARETGDKFPLPSLRPSAGRQMRQVRNTRSGVDALKVCD